MPFKPMLATAIDDITALKFPLLASRKLDGVRATVQGGRLLARSLKPIPNKYVQALFKGLAEGIDGELIVGDPCAPDAYRKTVSLVMSDDKPLDFFSEPAVFYVFDKFGKDDGGLDQFQYRLDAANKARFQFDRDCKVTQLVEHKRISSVDELESLEAEWLEDGNEGVMLRSINGPYKQGRSSIREGYLLKLKRFKDFEAEVISFFELMHNDNDAQTNELGRTFRSSHQANKIGLKMLGGLIVKGMGGDYDGVEFRCGTGYDDEMRETFWKDRASLIGKIAKIKYFPSGSKDKPRFPVFLGWRDARDI